MQKRIATVLTFLVGLLAPAIAFAAPAADNVIAGRAVAQVSQWTSGMPGAGQVLVRGDIWLSFPAGPAALAVSPRRRAARMSWAGHSSTLAVARIECRKLSASPSGTMPALHKKKTSPGWMSTRRVCTRGVDMDPRQLASLGAGGPVRLGPRR